MQRYKENRTKPVAQHYAIGDRVELSAAISYSAFIENSENNPQLKFTFTTHSANSADDKLMMIYFLFFPENRTDTPLESIYMDVKSCSLENIRKIFQYVVC